MSESPLIANGESERGDKYIAYRYRFYILAIFCGLEMANATMWVTFAPISDIAQSYFGSGYYASTTAVNMMANIFLILYGPGTVLSVFMMKSLGLRTSLLTAGALTVVGALLRYVAALCESSLGGPGVYWLMFIGQCFSAFAQPMFLNSPPAVSSIWFPVNERDLATTVGSMFSPIGNAVGQLIPVFLVSQSSKSKHDDDDFSVSGMADLMLVELIICAVPLLVAAVYLRDRPPSAPSQSTKMKLDARLSALKGNGGEGQTTKEALVAFWKEVTTLFSNKDYVLLFIAFSIGVGFFNSLLTLLNQIVAPFGYSNDDAGTFAAVFILFGLIGAGCIGTVMEKTRAYRTILKGGIVLCLLLCTLFLVMLFSDNFWPLVCTFALLGFFLLPLLPVCMENCAECTYPIGEEVSMGIMLVGCNILGLGFVFALQFLLEVAPLGPPPFLPSNIFMFCSITAGVVVLMFYNGEYKRLKNEALRDRLLSGANSASLAGTSGVGGKGDGYHRHGGGGGSGGDDVESSRFGGFGLSDVDVGSDGDGDGNGPSRHKGGGGGGDGTAEDDRDSTVRPLLSKQNPRASGGKEHSFSAGKTYTDSSYSHGHSGSRSHSSLFGSFYSGRNSAKSSPANPAAAAIAEERDPRDGEDLVRVTSVDSTGSGSGTDARSSHMNSSLNLWNNPGNNPERPSMSVGGSSTQSDGTLMRPSVYSPPSVPSSASAIAPTSHEGGNY